MATEQYLTHTSFQSQPPFEDDAEKWKPSIGTDINSSGGFDCNICLDAVQDPVVTLCGHLYCWPCIYKWIRQQRISPEIPVEQEPQCPVCKAEISEKTLIPLYARSQAMTGSEGKGTNLGPAIPCRPKGPPCGVNTLATHPTTRTSMQDAHHHHSYPPYETQPPAYYPYYGGEYNLASAPAITLAGTTTFHPVISMFGEMICARFYGDSQSLNSYPNSYSVAGTGSGRAMRRVMQADRSLSRLWFFLFCCLVLCLVFF